MREGKKREEGWVREMQKEGDKRHPHETETGMWYNYNVPQAAAGLMV